jgi:hypothetical protein
MKLGIVGSEAAKFTPATEKKARELIRTWAKKYDEIISGGCHLGGIDIWAKEEANNLDIPFKEFLPKTRNWEGYKARNIQIAENSHVVICITVRTLPPGYKRRGFESPCYHCDTSDHIKSGGCWTVKYAKLKLHRVGLVLVIEENDDSQSQVVQ